jgi:hypothetical protein
MKVVPCAIPGEGTISIHKPPLNPFSLLIGTQWVIPSIPVVAYLIKSPKVDATYIYT